MIVKDEAATIKTTLASMREHIDDWTIVDTGSTDGTQAASTLTQESTAVGVLGLGCAKCQKPIMPSQQLIHRYSVFMD